jgi:plastocyanin
MRHRTILIGVATVWAAATWLQAQGSPTVEETSVPFAVTVATSTTTVRGRVEVIGVNIGGKESPKAAHGVIPGTVVWLTPVNAAATEAPTSVPGPTSNPASARLVQKNKSFDPHILVVPAGSMVEFPNRDPFFHNVFSLFEGKRFDLGLYEAGSSRMVRFDRPGISYIFCNIHPEMSAVVLTMATPFYAVANADGQLNLTGVPYGRYTLHIWSEGMGPENVQPLTREITIAENASSLGVIRVPQTDGQRAGHKNKYGRDYDEPTPNNSVYRQQR